MQHGDVILCNYALLSHLKMFFFPFGLNLCLESHIFEIRFFVMQFNMAQYYFTSAKRGCNIN